MNILKRLFARPPKGTPLPDVLPGQLWWAAERRMQNTRSGEVFRIFEAVIAPDKATARVHLAAADAQLDAVLMKQALRLGNLVDEYDRTPASRELACLQLTRVQTEEQIAALDPALLDMLKEHDFFRADFAGTPDMAVGGGVYPD